jgi:hypothetical protein
MTDWPCTPWSLESLTREAPTTESLQGCRVPRVSPPPFTGIVLVFIGECECIEQPPNRLLNPKAVKPPGREPASRQLCIVGLRLVRVVWGGMDRTLNSNTCLWISCIPRTLDSDLSHDSCAVLSNKPEKQDPIVFVLHPRPEPAGIAVKVVSRGPNARAIGQRLPGRAVAFLSASTRQFHALLARPGIVPEAYPISKAGYARGSPPFAFTVNVQPRVAAGVPCPLDMQTIDALVRKVRAGRRLPAPEACRTIRVQAGLSERDIAEAIGVSRPTISRWETGARRPQPGGHLEAYAGLLDRLAGELRGPP